MKREGEEAAVKEVVQEMERVLLIECGGEEEEGEMVQAENEHGEGGGDGEDEELWGEVGTVIETTSNGTTSNATDNTPTATTTTTTTTTPQEFLDSTESIVDFHGCFSNETDAKKHALATFLDLAKPAPTQPDEDKHYFEYTVVPYYQDTISDAIERGVKWDPNIEWEPETKYKWNFFRLTVKVVETELQGPIDPSDLVVEGPEGVPSGGTPVAPAAPRPAPAKENPAPQTQPADPAPSLLKPSTPPPPSPERRFVSVAPATAPENPAPAPNPAAPAAGGTSSTANLLTTTAAAGTPSTTNPPTTTPPNPAPTHPVPPAQAALYAAAQAARYAAAGLPHRPAAAATPPFARTTAPFAMVGDDESEVSEEE
ncbi:hypothetical protein B0T18DRAFT_396298 [Schizothecium vesticola]|uniref:Uncharacterized protein n=1 Tax=Schizothecium vesticola TaxID=314040 RepID=A0AA40KBU6_9PEZI|nr:hypothetical protein B0T18DRAFT_396298 [Schizothecium vesticola]